MKLGSFFYMHKSDRRITLALLVVLVVILACIIFGGRKDESPKTTVYTAPSDSTTTDSSVVSQNPSDATPSNTAIKKLFPFDPNTADSAQLRRLGLSSYLVNNIYRYRAAGGAFTTKEDFARLYGLTVKQYRELEPYIKISPDYRPAATLFPHRTTRHTTSAPHHAPSHADSVSAGLPSQTASPRYSTKLSEGETIELNSADTTALQRIPGIGPYYARRIADYRHRLGGFISLSQLDEIDDLPPQTKQYLTLDANTLRRINVNTATLNDLKRHPYINFYQARAIVDYRRQHGPINSLQDLRLLTPFTPDAIERLMPYVEY
jgi:DNA uptake protein ComE-like DNA-binding protein